jgi:predicted DNA helicase
VILRSQRLVLAGDHCQLPPTVLCPTAAAEGFAVSLMERLVKHYGDQVTRQLSVQYRMHQQIMQFSSAMFYDHSLSVAEPVAAHVLADLAEVTDNTWTREPILFVDTAGAGWDEELEPDGESRRNPQEGRLVLKMIERLTSAGLNPEGIAVIAPYAAQVRWLREHCPERSVEVDTVDGFQGREKEAVIISLVRSNPQGEIGFLGDTRRMNVALTRARRKLVVIGDSATLGGHRFYAQLLEYFESIGAYHTVWEEEWLN